METEIELKFLVLPEIAESLKAKLLEYKILQHSSKKLFNTYYDTNDQVLRKIDAGLRVRSFDGVFVQTLKTSGRVIAGLHQRPEYNYELQQDLPNIDLIENSVWPDNFSVSYLKENVTPLFSTNFLREQWLVCMPDGSQIEVAFDQGCVSSELVTTTDNICEVELELKSGQTESLFTLARELNKNDGMRLGNISKAARGYKIIGAVAPEKVEELALIDIKHQDSLEDALIKILEHGLSHWIKHEQLFVETFDRAAIVEIQQSISLIRQAITVFGPIIPRRASSLIRQELNWFEEEITWLSNAINIDYLMADENNYFKKLAVKDYLLAELVHKSQAFPSDVAIVKLMQSSRYTSLLLDLNRWILTKGWQPFLNDKSKEKLKKEIKPYADKIIDKSWYELLASFPVDIEISRQQYLDLWKSLNRNLMTGLCFAALYQNGQRSSFILPWLDVKSGIEDLQLLAPLHLLVDSIIDQENKNQLIKWLNRKEEYLMHALDKTRKSGVELKPYWK